MDLERPVTVRKAILLGLLIVNGPVLLLLVGGPLLLIAGARPGSATAGPWPFAVAFATAWLWWSLAVPRWRLWAYGRVADIPALKARAVAVGLVWPDGHFFSRTEIKTRAHAAREFELETRSRRGISPDQRA